MDIFTENWNGHNVRFILVDNEWWAVGIDVCNALGYVNHNRTLKLHCKGVPKRYPLETAGGIQNLSIISEKDIYRLIMRSNLPEAEEFQCWVFDILRDFRLSSGLLSYQIGKFTIDKEEAKEHQIRAMDYMKANIPDVSPADYRNANTIANKCVSNIYSFDKMLSKDDMDDEMLAARQVILDATTKAYIGKAHLRLVGMDAHISEAIYKKFQTIEDVWEYDMRYNKKGAK